MSVRRLTRNQSRQLCGVLAFALFVLTILPAHFHLHHVAHDPAHTHEHFVDIHIFPHAAEAAHHEDAQVLKITPDGIVKNFFVKFVPVLFLALGLLCFALPVRRCILRVAQAVFIPAGNQYSKSPPQRGPPAPT